MTAVWIALAVLGFSPFLAGAVFLFRDNPGVFLQALGISSIVVGGLALASFAIAQVLS